MVERHHEKMVDNNIRQDSINGGVSCVTTHGINDYRGNSDSPDSVPGVGQHYFILRH